MLSRVPWPSLPWGSQDLGTESAYPRPNAHDARKEPDWGQGSRSMLTTQYPPSLIRVAMLVDSSQGGGINQGKDIDLALPLYHAQTARSPADELGRNQAGQRIANMRYCWSGHLSSFGLEHPQEIREMARFQAETYGDSVSDRNDPAFFCERSSLTGHR